MFTWTLAEIRKKLRQVTGRFNLTDISISELDKYINRYYLYELPALVKLEQNLVIYEFITSANQATYAFPLETYTNFHPEATVNNLPLNWHSDPYSFHRDSYSFSDEWIGDGATKTFTTTLTTPIKPGSLTISSTDEYFKDSSTTWTTADVVLSGSEGGSALINYNTGSVAVTFNTAPTLSENIKVNFCTLTTGRPQDILVYNSQFELYPVPDQAYVVQMNAYQQLDALTDATDTPFLNEWGPCIAYGAARSLFADYGETDAYAETGVLHNEQISLILTRTVENLLNTRAIPNF
jgi:hypothetical protein